MSEGGSLLDGCDEHRLTEVLFALFFLNQFIHPSDLSNISPHQPDGGSQTDAGSQTSPDPARRWTDSPPDYAGPQPDLDGPFRQRKMGEDPPLTYLCRSRGTCDVTRQFDGPSEAALGGGLSNCPEE